MPDLFRDRGYKRVVWFGGPRDGEEVIVPNVATAVSLPFTVGFPEYPIEGDRIVYSEWPGPASGVPL